MSAPAPQRLSLVRGDDYSGEDAIVLDASSDAGLDLTACDDVVMTVRERDSSPDAVWRLSLADGDVTVVDASTAAVDLPASRWEDWTGRSVMAWDVEGSFDGRPRTLAMGTISVVMDVTRG